jgi:hypothetical protein
MTVADIGRHRFGLRADHEAAPGASADTSTAATADPPQRQRRRGRGSKRGKHGSTPQPHSSSPPGAGASLEEWTAHLRGVQGISVLFPMGVEVGASRAWSADRCASPARRMDGSQPTRGPKCPWMHGCGIVCASAACAPVVGSLPRVLNGVPPGLAA